LGNGVTLLLETGRKSLPSIREGMKRTGRTGSAEVLELSGGPGQSCKRQEGGKPAGNPGGAT